MERYQNGNRYKNYSEWENLKNEGYNYKKNGLIQHILSSRISKTKNDALRVMLAAYEKSIIHVLEYTDYLKHFKNYHWRNR